VLIFWCWISRD